MPTIEERLLQRNVPGRFSSWADEDAEEDRQSPPAAADSEDSEEGSECEDGMEAPACGPGDGLNGVDDDLAVLQHRQGPNTGPKGVLADHRAQQRAAHARRRQAKVSQSPC